MTQVNAAVYNKKYGVLHILKTERKENTIRYETEITLLQTKHGGRKIFTINRSSDVFINDMLPDLIVDELAHEAGKALYPLTIETDKEGVFENVCNVEELRTEWPIRRSGIENYFKGEEVSKYLQLMEDTINNNRALFGIFENDLFFSTFFFPFYTLAPINSKAKQNLFFNVPGKAIPILFEMEQEIKKNLHDDTSIDFIYTGASKYESISQNVEQEKRNSNEQPPKVTFNAYYVLDSSNYSLKSCIAKWIVHTEKELTHEIKFFQLQE